MIKFFSKFFRKYDNNLTNVKAGVVMSKQDLEKKVVEGANKAINDYKETFKILAEYDKF